MDILIIGNLYTAISNIYNTCTDHKQWECLAVQAHVHLLELKKKYLESHQAILCGHHYMLVYSYVVYLTVSMVE